MRNAGMQSRAAKTAGRTAGKRLPTVLTRAECAEIVKAVGHVKSMSGARNMALVQIMLGAGLRVSEVCALRGTDVDAQEGRIEVRGGKGDKDRIVWVGDDVKSALKDWDAKRRELGINGRHPYFVGIRNGGNGLCERQPNEPLSVRTVQELVAKLAAQAGIEKRVSPHTLRHTYATIGLNNGLSTRDMQKLLGHAAVTTTEIYTHVLEDELRLKVQGAPAAEDDPDKAIMAALAGMSQEAKLKLAKALTAG